MSIQVGNRLLRARLKQLPRSTNTGTVLGGQDRCVLYGPGPVAFGSRFPVHGPGHDGLATPGQV